MDRIPRIRIGNQTAFSAASITLPFEYAVEHNFDAFEWFPDRKASGEGWAEEDINDEQRTRIRETAEEHNISLSVHASLQINPLLGNAERLISGIRFAEDIGAAVFNIHLLKDEGIDVYARAILPLAAELSNIGVRLSIENTPYTGPEDFEILFSMLRELIPGECGNVGMCLDIGHANLCSATMNNYLGFVDQLSPEIPIFHVHMHENFGDSDSHLPLFTGPAARDDSGIRGLISRLIRRGFSGSVILEQWPQPASLLTDARKRLLQIIDELPVDLSSSMTSGSSDFASEIADMNIRDRSWRKKIGWIHDLLTDPSFEVTIDRLVYLAVYLRFVGTGKVTGGEDGGHYRPSHHARMSMQIHPVLMKMTTPDNVFIMRKIYPWLPSFDNVFMRAEPLTLIRDIAHRNDIPQDLKSEIKHTLQNKLHRSAGPEDLVTSAALLERITAPGVSYSADFVREFRRFHAELQEFFNAGSLEQQLRAIQGHTDKETTEVINRFLAAKKGAGSIEDLVFTFSLLTELRSVFQKRMETGSGAELQRLMIADIRLEDFSFVILSSLINAVGSQWDDKWGVGLRCLDMAVTNLRLSGFDEEECLAIGAELKAWSRDFDPSEREQLLRLKATIDRCMFLAEDYCSRLLSLFPERVERLGHLLGVAEAEIKIYLESDIRAHPVFQLSKITSELLRALRSLAGLPPWDVIVPGTAAGRLVEAGRLEDIAPKDEGEVIALIRKLDGEEEIPGFVKGIMVTHQTPHLSHLAVRARQAGTLLAACDDTRHISELRKFTGEKIILDASAEEIRIRLSQVSGEASPEERRQTVLPVPVIELDHHNLLRLSQVTPATGGSKANSARLLEELSHADGAGFKTPGGIVVPFGVFQRCLDNASALSREYRKIVRGLDKGGSPDLDTGLKRLREIISLLELPAGIISGIRDFFNSGSRLIARSSSSCEDLEGLSGAGLYTSVANVSMDLIADAIRKVWASLWTRRAVMDRTANGIPQASAHMAVLVQELIVPDFSFVLHTVNPVSLSKDELYMEIAVGLGETLASGAAPGAPYRMTFDKQTRRVKISCFGSFSKAVFPGRDSMTINRNVDYSEVVLSVDGKARERIAGSLGEVGCRVEDSLGLPQDVEGVIAGDTIYLVQSRPQQGGWQHGPRHS